MTVANLLSALRRHRLLMLVPIAIFVLLAAAYLSIAHRYYQAASRVEVSTNTAQVNLGQPNSSASMGDALEVNSFVQTQVQILQSEAIAIKVIKALNLDQAPGYQASVIGKANSDGFENTPSRLDKVLQVFEKNLSVQVVPATHIIEVRFTDRDPNRAAAVVNATVQELINYNYETKFNESSQVNGFLSSELSSLRKRSEDAQAKWLASEQQGGVLSGNSVTSEGKSESYNPALDRVRGASEMLLQAENSAILKGAIYEVARDGNAEAISTLSGTALATSSQGVNSSFNALQNLRGQEASLEQQLDQARTKYGPKFPKLVELQSSLDAVHREIKNEAQRISDRAANDYRIAEVTRDADRKIYEDARREVLDLNGRAAESGILREEADQSRKLYQDVLGQVQEASILERLRSSTIVVVDKARPSSKPSRPNAPVLLAAALAAGLFFGLLSVFAVETIGDKLTSIPAVEAEIGATALAVLPAFRGPAASPEYLEAVRTLRARVLGTPDLRDQKVFLITSSVAKEGKSTVAFELARTLANNGRKVLLVDANLRQPALTEIAQAPATPGLGLAEILSRSSQSMSPVAIKGVPTLDFLPSGIPILSPADLLDGPLFSSLVRDWRLHYDFVLIDSPAVLTFSDALELIPSIDHVLLIIRDAAVSHAQLRTSLAMLLAVVPGEKISAVINAVQNGL